MSKIATYGLADTPLQLSDRLIGTEAPRPIPSSTPLATKNFSLGELLQLFSDNFPAASLQAVLDTNNTATQNINLTGTISSTLIKPTNIEDSLGSQGTVFQVLSKSVGGINWIDIPVNYPTLNEVLNQGNVSILDAKIGKIYLYNTNTPSGNGYVNISGDKNRFNFYDNTDKLLANISKDTFSFGDFSSPYIFSIKKPTTISANHIATLQDTSGVIAYLQDIPNEITLTTIGNTGPATLIGDVLNIPDYSGGFIPTLGYVPYIGATQNVDLGEYELKAGQVTLDVSPTGTATVGTTRWNNTIGSSETTLKGGNVILKNGIDLVVRVVNKVTPNATLLRSNYQAVRISGAQGQRLAVAYAQANNDNNSADTIGLVCENISTNQEGFIITVGQLLEVNTTGSLQGESWSDGDVLYLSPTTPGSLTNIKPTGATGHIVVIGYVEYAHAIHGSIYVKIMNGWELDELHNVSIISPTNNELLAYNSSNQLWENKTLSEVNAQQFFMNLPYRYINTAQSIGSNAAGETQLIRVTIPANTFSSNDKFYFRLGFSKVGTANAATIRVKLTTASSMPSGATSQIGLASIGNTALYGPMERNMAISGGNLKGYAFGTANVSDSGTNTAAWSSVAFDTTQTQYFYVSITPAATTTDVTYLEYIEITNI